MKLWTFQHPDVVKKLKNGENHSPSRESIFSDEEMDGDHSVLWMADLYEWGRIQAEKRTGKKWTCLPVFCWTEKPDIRKFKSGVKKTALREYVLIELDVPALDFLLSSYHIWSAGPMSGSWIDDEKSKDSNLPPLNMGYRNRFFDSPQEYLLNWERCFDKSFCASSFAQEYYCELNDFSFHQAMVHGIKCEWVKSFKSCLIAW